MLKKFALLSFGILCLALTVLIVNDFITPKAGAQAGQTVVGYGYDFDTSPGVERHRHFVMMANGDVFMNIPQTQAEDCHGIYYRAFDCSPVYIGNFWGSGPVPTSGQTMGSVKSQYQPKK